MRTNAVPKTVKKMLASCEAVEEAWVEYDEGGEPHEGPYGLWARLRPGYVSETGGRYLHEHTAAKFIAAAKAVVREC